MRSDGVEGRGRILRHVRDELAARTAQGLGAERQQVDAADLDRAASRCACRASRGRAARLRPSSCPSPTPRRARRSRRARARERDLVDDLAAAGQLDAQVRDAQGAHAPSPPPTRATAREMPSVTKFVPIAKIAMHAAGRDDRPGLERDAVAVLVDHQAPVRVRRLDPEAEEADRGDHGDRPREAQSVLDEQRRGDVREHLADEDPAARQTDRLGRLHVLAVHDVRGHAARDARDLRHPRERDEPDDEREIRAQHRDEEQHEHDLREGQDDVHHAHQRVVEARAREPREHADAGAHPNAQRGRRERHPDDAATAPEQPREHVVAEVVRAQREVGRGLLERNSHECRGIVRRHERADGGDHHDGRRDRDAEARAARAQRARAHRRAQPPPRRKGDAHRRNPVRSRGETTIVSTSASRLKST